MFSLLTYGFSPRTRFSPFKTAWLVVCHPFRACGHGLRPRPRHSDAVGHFLLFSYSHAFFLAVSLFEGVFECLLYLYSSTACSFFLADFFLYTGQSSGGDVGFGPHTLPQNPFEMGSSVRGEQELSDESKISLLAPILPKL